jgi:hypothetical protein
MTTDKPENQNAKAPKGVQIDKVDAAPVVQSNPNWISVFKAINPLGHVAEAYAKTLAYRIETKRLEGEFKRVELQAEAAHHLVDKAFQLKMEDLQQRRLALDRFFDTVQQHLSHLHIERMEVLKMAERCTTKALEAGVPIAERTLFKELAMGATEQLSHFGQNANQSLQAIVQSLPRVQLPAALLGDDE